MKGKEEVCSGRKNGGEGREKTREREVLRSLTDFILF